MGSTTTGVTERTFEILIEIEIIFEPSERMESEDKLRIAEIGLAQVTRGLHSCHKAHLHRMSI